MASIAHVLGPEPEHDICIRLSKGGPSISLSGPASILEAFRGELEASSDADYAALASRLNSASEEPLKTLSLHAGSSLLYRIIKEADTLAASLGDDAMQRLTAITTVDIAHDLHSFAFRDEQFLSHAALHIGALLVVREEVQRQERESQFKLPQAHALIQRQLTVAVSSVIAAPERGIIEHDNGRTALEKYLLKPQTDKSVQGQLSWFLTNWEDFNLPNSGDGVPFEFVKLLYARSEESLNVSFEAELAEAARTREVLSALQEILAPQSHDDQRAWNDACAYTLAAVRERAPKIVDLTLKGTSHPRAAANFFEHSRAFQLELLEGLAAAGYRDWVIADLDELAPASEVKICRELRLRSKDNFQELLFDALRQGKSGTIGSVAEILGLPPAAQNEQLIDAELQHILAIAQVLARYDIRTERLFSWGNREKPWREQDSSLILSYRPDPFFGGFLSSCGLPRRDIFSLKQQAANRMWREWGIFSFADGELSFHRALDEATYLLAEEGGHGWGRHMSVGYVLPRVLERGLGEYGTGASALLEYFDYFPLRMGHLECPYPKSEQSRDLYILTQTPRGPDDGDGVNVDAPTLPGKRLVPQH